MAQTSTPSPAAARKHAVAASRGAVLALHSAAGMAVLASREAERLLRASEGLARAAVACLEHANRGRDAAPGGATRCDVGASSTALPETTPTSSKLAKKKRTKKGKDKGFDAKMELDIAGGEANRRLPQLAMPTHSGAPGGPAALLSASPAVFGPWPEPAGFDDGWADGLPTVRPAEPPAAVDGATRRPLLPRRSGSRSPRREDDTTVPSSSPSASTPAPSPVALVVGHIAAVCGLTSRPELNGLKCRLIEFSDDLWLCDVGRPGRVRLRTTKLAGLHAQFQGLAEEQFKKQHAV